MELLRNVKGANLFAFTLAEVLITLGIIGVVAAITIPSLIQHHQQQVVVSKLKKFHSVINQAVKLSEAENGSCSYWDIPVSDSNADILNFYNNYLSKYIKSTGITEQNISRTANSAITRSRNIVKLNDGSVFVLDYYNVSNRLLLMYFYPQANKLDSDNLIRDRFAFELYRTKCIVEPYGVNWDGTRNQLKLNKYYGCNKTSTYKYYCAKLIEYDGWQISKDYPW